VYIVGGTCPFNDVSSTGQLMLPAPHGKEEERRGSILERESVGTEVLLT